MFFIFNYCRTFYILGILNYRYFLMEQHDDRIDVVSSRKNHFIWTNFDANL